MPGNWNKDPLEQWPKTYKYFNASGRYLRHDMFGVVGVFFGGGYMITRNSPDIFEQRYDDIIYPFWSDYTCAEFSYKSAGYGGRFTANRVNLDYVDNASRSETCAAFIKLFGKINRKRQAKKVAVTEILPQPIAEEICSYL